MNFFLRKNFRRIRHFHPEGLKMPNGIYHQRGAYIQQCLDNAICFQLTKDLHQLRGFCGGIILFPSDASKRIIISTPYKVGSIFHGKYISPTGEIFDSHSLTIEIDNLQSRDLFKYADFLAKSFPRETLLLKDLNTNRFYLRKSLC